MNTPKKHTAAWKGQHQGFMLGGASPKRKNAPYRAHLTRYSYPGHRWLSDLHTDAE